jgi:LuxR family maltose regulon positive regulatory protein
MLSRASELYQQALEVAPESPVSASAHLGLALLLYERNELESAMAHCETGLELNRLTGNPSSQYGLLTQSMVIAMTLGDEVRALRATKQLDQFAAGSVDHEPRSSQAMYHMVLARRQGHADEASLWEDRLVRLEGEGPIAYWERLALIRRLGIQGKRDEVAQQIERLYQNAGIEPLAPDWKDWSITVRTAQALVASNQEEALGFLAEALQAGDPQGWIRSFVDMGPRMIPLLRKAVSQGIYPEYAAKLLTIMEAEQRRTTDMGRSPRPSSFYAVLTERELEILRLVGAGMSNRQIAGKLYISVGTVKVHLHNISEKLSATSRTGALARARELKLL